MGCARFHFVAEMGNQILSRKHTTFKHCYFVLIVHQKLLFQTVWFTANFYILTLEWNKQDKNKDVCSACNRRVWLLGWRRKRYLLLRSDVDLLETCRIGKLWGRAIYQWHITKPQMPKKIWDLSEKNILSSLIFNLIQFLLNQNEKYLSISELRRGIKKQPISENRLWLVIVKDNPFKREM